MTVDGDLDEHKTTVGQLLERLLFPTGDDVWWADESPPSDLLARIADGIRPARLSDRFTWPLTSQDMLGTVRGDTIAVRPAHRNCPYAEIPEFRGRCYVASDGKTYVNGAITYPDGWLAKLWLGGVSLFLVLLIGLALIETFARPIGTRTGTWAVLIGVPAAMLAGGLVLFVVRRQAAAVLRTRLLKFLSAVGTSGSVLVVNRHPFMENEPGS